MVKHYRIPFFLILNLAISGLNASSLGEQHPLIACHLGNDNPYSIVQGAIFSHILLDNIEFFGNTSPQIKQDQQQRDYLTYESDSTSPTIKFLHLLFHRTGTFEGIENVQPTTFTTKNIYTLIKHTACLATTHHHLENIAQKYTHIRSELNKTSKQHRNTLQGLIKKIVDNPGNDHVIAKSYQQINNIFSSKNNKRGNISLKNECTQLVELCTDPRITRAIQASTALFDFKALGWAHNKRFIQLLLYQLIEAQEPHAIFPSDLSLQALMGFLYSKLEEESQGDNDIFKKLIGNFYYHVGINKPHSEEQKNYSNDALPEVLLTILDHEERPFFLSSQNVSYEVSKRSKKIITFPICTEAAIANFLLWHSYSDATKKHSIEKLEENLHNPIKKRYYTLLKNCLKNPYNAAGWAQFFSNMANIKYKQKTGDYYFELTPSLANISRVIMKIFEEPLNTTSSPQHNNFSRNPIQQLARFLNIEGHASKIPWRFSPPDSALKNPNLAYALFKEIKNDSTILTQFTVQQDPAHAYFQKKIINNPSKSPLLINPRISPSHLYLYNYCNPKNPSGSPAFNTLILALLAMKSEDVINYFFRKIVPQLYKGPKESSYALKDRICNAPLPIIEQFLMLGLRFLWGKQDSLAAQRLNNILRVYKLLLKIDKDKILPHPKNPILATPIIVKKALALIKFFLESSSESSLISGLGSFSVLTKKNYFLTNPEKEQHTYSIADILSRNNVFFKLPHPYAAKTFFWYQRKAIIEQFPFQQLPPTQLANLWKIFAESYTADPKTLRYFCTSDKTWNLLVDNLQQREVSCVQKLAIALDKAPSLMNLSSFFILSALLKNNSLDLFYTNPRVQEKISNLILSLTIEDMELLLKKRDNKPYLEYFLDTVDPLKKQKLFLHLLNIANSYQHPKSHQLSYNTILTLMDFLQRYINTSFSAYGSSK